MLEALGIAQSAEIVYRLMLERPDYGVADMARRLGWTEQRVREELGRLTEARLISMEDDSGEILPFDPEVGFSFLLSRAEGELSRRRRQVERAERAVADILAARPDRSARHDVVHRVVGLETVRRRLEDLAANARTECLSLLPGGAQLPDTMDASQPLDQLCLERGVRIRSIYQDSFRNDPPTVDYVRWYCDLGGEARTVPVVPMLMVIVDREAALVPVDPEEGRAGALEVRSPGLVHALVVLFDQLWDTGTPFGEAPRRDEHDLSPRERELLMLLGIGCTDDLAARRLGISLRTVRRMSSELRDRLGARSRFEAGVRAVKEGWL
ncbi:helix-turn-helix transcriptional regulator [Streptomyces sp. WZ.A104]|uniref:Helix-turn-helix transcriptional regulator n=1 Tax=Streptomyces durocortorensis TaxID=2811104 RepID=A0ABY9W0I7_9ACTN|nr:MULTISPECIES: helix-turn-helix transcriptional regulator [Streptomyces]PCG86413.1 helix-turn-helix transcriptional regulator [Streptomyces sp. WZ.A104]WNF29488.1 helix-turn-helix transcriptional regulator [Streptomyces durocortorensis]